MCLLFSVSSSDCSLSVRLSVRMSVRLVYVYIAMVANLYLDMLLFLEKIANRRNMNNWR